MEQPLPFTAAELELMRCLVKYSAERQWDEDANGDLYGEAFTLDNKVQPIYKSALLSKIQQHELVSRHNEFQAMYAEKEPPPDTPETIAEKIGIPQITKRFNELVSGKPAQ